MEILELFGGIGALTTAFKRLGIPYHIADYVEIDKYAVKSYNAMNGTNFEPQDICTWDKDIKVDLIMHGSPCQDFSLAGKQAGGDEGSGTRSSLMYETIRIVEKLKPKYVIWENVKNLLSKKHRHNFDAYLETMEQLGYTNYYQVLNAKDYGIPQNRERVFTISIQNIELLGETEDSFVPITDFKFPEKQELKLKLKDMLEEEVDEKYYLSDKTMLDFIYKTKVEHENYTQFDRYNGRFEQLCRIWKDTSPALHLKSNDIFIYDEYLKIKNATKKGYLEATNGDGVNISSRMKYQRGNVQKESIQTLTTSGGNDRGVIVGSTQKHAAISTDGIVPTLTSAMGQGGGHVPMHDYDLKIRKLTPKECWRLMAFDDEDFEKATKVNSNTQLYKQAGNSIVVNVLVAILKNLLFSNEQTDVIEAQTSIYGYLAC